MATKATSSVITSISAAQIQAGLAAAGNLLTFNASTNTWVASAAPQGGNIFTGAANQSLTSNGFQVLPGGIIIVWGGGITTGSSTISVTFAKAFPNACFYVIPCTRVPSGDTGGASVGVTVSSASKTGCNLNTIASTGWGYTFIAFGY